MRNAMLILLLFLAAHSLRAQDAQQLIREGNRAVEAGKTDEALAFYEEAAGLGADKYAAYFNMGNVYYDAKKWKEAEQAYLNALSAARNKTDKARVWHNLGNTYLAQDQYREAVKAYKEALKLRPDDEDTRYNLAYALSKWKKEEEQKQKNKNKQQKQDQKENQKDKNQEQKENQEQDQKNKSQENKENQKQKDKQNQGEQEENEGNKREKNEDKSGGAGKQEEQQKEEKEEGGRQAVRIDPKQAERLLKALERQEGKIQEEMWKKKAGRTRKRKSEKDW